MSKKSRINNINAGLCSNGCKLPLASKWYCQKCLDRTKKNNSNRAASLLQSGLCRECGKLPSSEGKTRCKNCLKEETARTIKRKTILSFKGMCVTGCGNKSTTGTRCTTCLSKHSKQSAIRAKKLRATNPKFKLDRNMSSAIWSVLKSKKAGRHWETLVPYKLDDLMAHLESLFIMMPNGEQMSWTNYGTWHVDHIKPLSKCNNFDEAWSLNNLQPLYGPDNCKKHAKLIRV